MFKGINILIAMQAQHADVISSIEKCADSMSFNVKVTSRTRDCLDYSSNGKDILILGKDISDEGGFLLERWTESVAGPVWVIASGDKLSDEEENALILAGAWNVARTTPEAAVIHMTLFRYGKIVQDSKLREEVKRLKRAVIALSFMVVALFGEKMVEVLPKLLTFLGF
jgi:hypothetical protein